MFATYDDWFKSKLNAIGDWDWTETGVDVFLLSNHPDIALGRAKDFFASIDAPILREGNIVKLFDSGYSSPAKIINMSKDDMVRVLGENGKKAFDGLRSKLNNIPIYVLMGASGEFGRGIGVRKMKKLYEAAKGDMSKIENFDFICSVEGFDVKTAQRIVDGKMAWNLFFTDIIEQVSIAPYETKLASTEGQLSGQVFVFTGFREKVLQQKIEEAGGTVVDSYSKKVTCVVAKDPSDNSTKLQKARKDGATVIGINDAWEMVE